MKTKISLLACLAVLLIGSFTVRNVGGAASTKIYANPSNLVDYSKVAGSRLNVTVNILNVTFLFAYQFNLTWNPIVLDIVNIYEGPFLKAGGPTSYLFNFVDGWFSLANTLVGEPFIDATPQSGNGVLFTIEFLVERRGWTPFDLGKTKVGVIVGFETVWINHDIGNGYFRNTPLGDLDSDGYVGPVDLSIFAAAYGKRRGQTGYNWLADLDNDGYIGPIDLSIFAANYGKRA